MRVSDFDFTLPESSIATHPCEPRDAAKLLCINPDYPEQPFSHRQFHDLPDLLSPGDALVINDSKVIPARLFGTRGEAKVEVLLHKPAPRDDGTIWQCFLRPGKRIKENDVIWFNDELKATVLKKLESGEALLSFVIPAEAEIQSTLSPDSHLHGNDEAFFSVLSRIGHMPLPPYIKRADEDIDKTEYQTVYARHPGSVAAPTAGLHFTPELLARLEARGIAIHRVTLHVGAGTFQPVKVDDTADHIMHSERAELSGETANTLNKIRTGGGKIVAVGTTALRILESAADQSGILHPFHGETAIFITPGYHFRAVDRLITNFHLPKSTLFMLVSAFSGLETMQSAYQHAIEQGYRFYSYGDACLLEKAIR